jgi:hypothetical protein
VREHDLRRVGFLEDLLPQAQRFERLHAVHVLPSAHDLPLTQGVDHGIADLCLDAVALARPVARCTARTRSSPISTTFSGTLVTSSNTSIPSSR